MAGLTDMEELLARITSKSVSDYMREALSCYGAGAYRACVVLTYIAVFEDLRQKLKALGPVVKVAKDASAEIEKIAEDQKPFETPLIHKLRSASIITTLEAERLEQIVKHRNKSAHPSGLHPSAEEARFVFYEAIDKFLSKELQQTDHIVNAVLNRLPESNYFPSMRLPDMKAVVASEVEGLHPLGLPSLVQRVVDMCESTDSTEARNAERFIVGLAARLDEDARIEIRDRLVKKKASDSKYQDRILMACAADPELMLGLPKSDRLRVNKLIQNQINSLDRSVSSARVRHPVNLLVSAYGSVGEAKLAAEFPTLDADILKKFPLDIRLIEAAEDGPSFRSKLLATYVDMAGSSEYAIANEFASNIANLDETLAQILDRVESLRIIAAVYRAGAWGAYNAKGLVSGKFMSTPKLKSKAEYAAKHMPKKALKALEGLGITDDLALFISKAF